MSHNFAGKFVPGCLTAVALLAPFHAAQAGKGFTVLYAFCQEQNCTDGSQPVAGLIADSAGNLYGTTESGGASNISGGTVFEVTPTGTETVLYSFCARTNCTDGNGPIAPLIRDAQGNLYGTTREGGANDDGTVFKVAPDGTETVLYSFGSRLYGKDGEDPDGGVIMDKKGNLYGTTGHGGIPGPDAGTVFKLAPDGKETVLYSFCSQANCADGEFPQTGLIMDKKGNLYGTTGAGGLSNSSICDYGCGVAFKVAPNGPETVLYSFCSQPNCSDGANPVAALVRDKAGNLYGTTLGGGNTSSDCDDSIFGRDSCGTAFKITPGGAETVLYSFCSQFNGTVCLDGSNPIGGLLDTGDGKAFYGATSSGGVDNTVVGFGGTVFKLAGGKETTLHTFAAAGPSSPNAGVIEVGGYLFGTTALNNDGSVFEVGTRGGGVR